MPDRGTPIVAPPGNLTKPEEVGLVFTGFPFGGVGFGVVAALATGLELGTGSTLPSDLIRDRDQPPESSIVSVSG